MQLTLQFSGSVSDSTLTETAGQREAVSSWGRGAVCVTAGPGSGKTYVLVERFRRLVTERGVDPRRILAVTYTEKAAQNLVERLAAGEADPARRQAFLRAPVSTLHAFCAGLLREHAFEAELDPEFSVMETWEETIERQRVIREVLEQARADDPQAAERFLRAFAGVDLEPYLEEMHRARCASDTEAFARTIDPEPALRDLIAALEDAARRIPAPDLIAEAQHLRDSAGRDPLESLARLDDLAEPLQTSGRPRGAGKVFKPMRDNLAPRCGAALSGVVHQSSREWLAETLRSVEERSQQWKRSVSKCDYSDLERRAARLLEKHPRLASRFDHVLVDEFQDTNPVQAKLMDLLQSGREHGARTLFAVGDINQSIYGFRYAAPEVFRRFRGDIRAHGGHLVELPENFRSRPEILRAAETILGEAEGIEDRPLRAVRKFPLKTAPSLEVFVARADDSPDAKRREARHLAARIFELRHELRLGESSREPRWGDFAILTRRRVDLETIAAELRPADIPYEVASGKGFFDAAEIRDLVHLLRILVNPRDEISLASVLRSPWVGISDETLLALKTEKVNLARAVTGSDRHPRRSVNRSDQPAEAAPSDSSLLLLIDPADAGRLAAFRERLDRLRRARDETPIDLLLSRAMAETGYEAYLLSQPDGRHQVANARKFLELARRQAESSGAAFDALVSRIEEMRASKSPEAEAPVLDQSVDAVQLMTIHAAKGLEFPVVILPALQSGSRSDSPAAVFSPEYGVGAKWKDPADGSGRADEALVAAQADRKLREAAESSRLFYVAMTRAEDHLVLSCSFGRNSRVGHWASVLQSKLGIDLQSVDDEPQVKILAGLRFRLFRTDADPAAEPRADADNAVSAVEWVEAVQAPIDHSDSATAVTAVALFAECPRRYYLSRYLGFPEDRGPGGGSAPASLANASEEAQETAAERDKPDPGELGSRVHAALAGTVETAASESEVIELVRRFRESELGRRVPADAKHEQDLLFLLDGRLLRGQIDLWFDNGDERILVDYKTDRVEGEQIAERARHYAPQLQLYAHAIEQAAGRPPDRAVLYFLRPDQAVEVDVGSEARQAAAHTVGRFFEAQSKLRFPLETGDHCFRCPHYRALCPAKLGTE